MNLNKSSSELRLVGLLVIVTLALGIAAIYARATGGRLDT
jgi:hypothetical protein